MKSRRDIMRIAGALAGCGFVGATAPGRAQPARSGLAALAGELARIERDSGGRLGVALRDTGSGEQASLHGGDAFPMCSTFKFLAAAAILRRVDEGKEKLDRRIVYAKSDLVTYSPITEKHVQDGMTLAQLCDAAVTLSDNTAGNLLLGSIGGPAGLTAFARSLGDPATRLDRIEPALNEAVPGDSHDTTTPLAMLDNVHKLVLGDALSAASRAHLTGWIRGSKTSAGKFQAGLPPSWHVGSKTGSGERGTTNEIGVAWPPSGAPVVFTLYLTNTTAAAKDRNATLAAVGRALAATFKS
jgi:beta-lactamase class A